MEQKKKEISKYSISVSDVLFQIGMMLLLPGDLF